jgi:ribosomal protein S18 acetylase RimI-like enzyme
VISIRLAGAADLRPILALNRPSPPDETKAAKVAQWISADYCHVAEAGGMMVGYGVRTENFFGSAFVEALMVDPNHRRQTIGTTMMRYFFASCPTPKLWTSTNLSNLPMQRLLAREGFILSGVVDNIDPGDPELFYVKRRDQPAL